jgi:uncharacterized membrane protein
MEALAILLVPLGIAYLVAPIAAFFMAYGNGKHVRALYARLDELERRLALQPAGAAREDLRTDERPAQEARTADIPPAPDPAAAIRPDAGPTPQPAATDAAPDTIAPPPPPPPVGTGRTEGLEQAIGTRWVVWVGGFTLALGGIFLVTYAVDQGYFGPGVRVILAGLLAAALIAAGEWARRSEKLSGFVGLPSAHVPSIFTAAGTTIAYATVYGAYALYDFIGPATAFVLLGIVAIATLAAALLHGPALAALGLVGAEVAPLLVVTDRPNYWALAIYLAIVTAAALTLARIRLWRWLAITAVAFGVLWTLPGIGSPETLAQNSFHVAAGFALAALLIVAGFAFGPAAEPSRIDAISSGALAAYVAVTGLLVVSQHHHALTLIVFAAMVAATLYVGWRTDAAVGAVPVAALVAALVMFAFALEREVAHLLAPGGVTAGQGPEPLVASVTLHLVLGFGFAILFGGAGFLAQGRSINALPPMLWAASGVVAPLAIVAALYYRIAGFERSIPFAGLALLLAAVFAYATDVLTKRTPRPGGAAAQAIYATGAVAGLALAFTLALEKGWLTVGLALMVPGVAWVERWRPLPALRWLAAAIVFLVIARIGWEPRIVGADVGTTPIFNWLLYGYGGPALAFWIGGYLLRQRADDVPARTVDSAAILFTVLLAVLEIRHYINNGDIYNLSPGLTEVALQVCVGLAMTIGLERVRGRTGNIVHDIGAIVVGALTLVVIVFGLLIVTNPLLWPRAVGGPFINLILLGYGIPAVLAIVLALVARTTRPMPYRAVAAVTAVVLSLMYLTLEVKRLYQGPRLNDGPITDAQQYTYSAVWLAYGVLLLVAGLVLQSKPARLASGAVILLTVAKVFLVDMSDLTGIWRALSFIGLGLVLVGIGYLYQRLLFPPSSRASQNASGAAEAAPP